MAAVGILAGIGLFEATGRSWPVLLGLTVLFLIPGRVQGHFWRPFFRGRRRMDEGAHASALVEFERFIWLNGAVYTHSVEAMALNNLGVCHLMLGQAPEAERVLDAAVAADPEYALPYFNLALLAQVRGDPRRAEDQRRRAQELGYAGATSDLLAH